MIAPLTDWQIADYAAGAVRREKKGGRPEGRLPPDPEPDLWDTTKTDRDTFVRRMRSSFSGSGVAGDFGAVWDEMKAKKDSERGKPDG